MRTLILMRHAQSNLGRSQSTDHQRPLTDRGRCQSEEMARWLAGADLVPQIILASTASRVRETVETMQAAWTEPPPAYFSDTLYLASPEGILQTIRSDSLDSPRVMIVAHNPGLEMLVYQFGGQPLAIPPATVAAFRTENDDWSRLSVRAPHDLLAYRQPQAFRD